MSTVAIIQARMTSTRLPGKVLADIAGAPLIIRVIDRVRAARGIDVVVVATTTDREDDALVEYVERHASCDVYRGSRDDVLSRFYHCAVAHNASTILRVTADDPLKDPEIIERALQVLSADSALDYCSNTLEPTYPEGLDIEVVRFRALARAYREAQLPSEREHVTPYIWKNPALFRIANFKHERDLSDWRWTVDVPADLEFMRMVYDRFAGQPLVPFREVVSWLDENPALLEINGGARRNEGYLQQLALEHGRK